MHRSQFSIHFVDNGGTWYVRRRRRTATQRVGGRVVSVNSVSEAGEKGLCSRPSVVSLVASPGAKFRIVGEGLPFFLGTFCGGFS